MPEIATTLPKSIEAPVAQPAGRATLLLATGFGLGYIPFASGTWGSLLSVGLYIGFERLVPFAGAAIGLELNPGSKGFALVHFALALAIAIAGVVLSGRAAAFFGEPDPHRVVIDEICGQQIAFLGLAPLGWKALIAGFLLFRIFDVWKPFPARQAEDWPGGWGIMADDWFAAMYAVLVLWGCRTLGHWL